ncbi:uncharacterized protein TM35_000024000 [Trypanosoma theileri]|uniref:Uncharacterized protein n=1 Tax=Trypanosoma theileri TaxID=67003 RepID=A0A1X0P824_9TRYP|nr:uncharacterized protein TM35_000024000 [Trypanosoma theileri]ORC93074.1 hypothetical protein TM35_000024000 [Trypanosoma theileri]
MTTMSVQLRRVVYLLVLLQCFVCVACAANASGDAEQHSSTIESTEKRKEDQVLNNTVEGAYEYIAHVYGCLSVLKEKKELCEEKYKPAEIALGTITTMVGEIEKIKREQNVSEPGHEWMKGKKAKIHENMNAVGDLAVSLVDVHLLLHACGALRDRLKVDVEKLAEVRNSSEANQTLIDLTKQLNSALDVTDSIFYADRVKEDAKKAMKDLMESLGNASKHVFDPVDIRGKKEINDTVEKRKDALFEELEKAKEEAKKKYRYLVQVEVVEEKEKSEVEDQPSMETEVPRREEESQKAQQKEAIKEVAGIKNTGEKEEKQKQEGEITEVANGTKMEAVKAIKAIQESDGSNSPALVCSPLLLLLLFVLGCTLVC